MIQTLLAGKPQGDFEAGADEEYFATLREFIAIVQDGPFEWAVEHQNDAQSFVGLLRRHERHYLNHTELDLIIEWSDTNDPNLLVSLESYRQLREPT